MSAPNYLRQADDGRYRFPVLVGEILAADGFPFASWASSTGFEYPADARTFLSFCGSAAEAFFAREFSRRAGVTYLGNAATADGITVTLQAKAGRYRIDALVANAHGTIAVEIDGLAFHRQSAEQVAADYLRQRRIVALGLPVVRFTANEVFGAPAECWRQIESILSQRKIS